MARARAQSSIHAPRMAPIPPAVSYTHLSYTDRNGLPNAVSDRPRRDGHGSGNPPPADAEYPAEPGRRGSDRVTATRRWSARAEQEIQSLSNQIGSRPDPDLESFAARFAQLEQNLAAIADRLDSLEQNVVALGQQASESRDRVEADIRQIENQLAEHTATLESSRTAEMCIRDRSRWAA